MPVFPDVGSMIVEVGFSFPVFSKTLNKLKIFIMAHKITDACKACGACIAECPVEAISEGAIYTIDADLCVDCGSCASVCPNDAIVAE